MMDNTWATPLFFPPHERGVDHRGRGRHEISLRPFRSAARPRHPPMRNIGQNCARPLIAFSMCAGPEDVFLGLRGLRTMDLRLREAQRQGLGSREPFSPARPEVSRVLHPGLPDRSRPCDLAPRFQRLVGPVFGHSETGVEGRRRGLSRCSLELCSALGIHGAVLKASSSPSIAAPTARLRNGSRRDLLCASLSGSRVSTISRPISTGRSRRCVRSTPEAALPGAGAQHDMAAAATRAPLAQLDRVSGFEPEGCRFEPCGARHYPINRCGGCLLLAKTHAVADVTYPSLVRHGVSQPYMIPRTSGLDSLRRSPG